MIKRKTFITAFLVVYFSFFAFTLGISRGGEVSSSGAIKLGVSNYGFPFIYYSSFCFGAQYLWKGLIGNIIFAAVLSFSAGMIASYFRKK